VLCVGATLHLARLLLGIDWVLPNFATPTFDMTLAAPLTFAAICLWAFRGDVHLRGRSQRVRYYAIATYVTLSVPIHVSTYFTRSSELLRLFPAWYSFVIVFVQLAVAIVMWRTSLRPLVS
jgi:hypothetical protein